jgi:3-hydroxybutyryl-CoA dehydrogenase
MAVYNLPTEPEPFILLTGDEDFVVEFAAILEAKDMDFAIVPPLDDTDLDDLAFYDDDAEMMAEVVASTTTFAPQFAHRITSEPRQFAGRTTHIVELGVSDIRVRTFMMSILASAAPKAVFVVSTLTNTATELASSPDVSDRVVGISLLPSMMGTASIIDMAAGLNTRPENIALARQLLERLGFTIELVEDRVGLVQARVLMTLINEAAFAVMEGVASPADIDNAMKLGVNYPKGLLQWADEIGIGVVTLCLDALYREYHQERYRPCVLLKQYMRAGWTGVAAGRGFYQYQS